ncbi:MAG: LmbE family protein [Rhodospirillales bacterium]|nr:LmbE family protein [Rhodospirillales bacterium]
MSLLENLRDRKNVHGPVALVVAHPDDEVLGLGSRLKRLKPLRIIHLTDGVPRDLVDATREGFSDWRSYAEARRDELVRALWTLDVRDTQLVCYRHPDQQAILHLRAIIARLAGDLAGLAAVITHAYEHAHPDHDTAAIAVSLACQSIATPGGTPIRLEFPSCHRARGETIFGRFCADAGHPETILALSEEEYAAKAAAIVCFRTQASVLAAFPVAPERLRSAPVYDFTRPAPPREAVYDFYGWNVTAARWRKEAARVLQGCGATSRTAWGRKWSGERRKSMAR